MKISNFYTKAKFWVGMGLTNLAILIFGVSCGGNDKVEQMFSNPSPVQTQPSFKDDNGKKDGWDRLGEKLKSLQTRPITEDERKGLVSGGKDYDKITELYEDMKEIVKVANDVEIVKGADDVKESKTKGLSNKLSDLLKNYKLDFIKDLETKVKNAKDNLGKEFEDIEDKYKEIQEATLYVNDIILAKAGLSIAEENYKEAKEYINFANALTHNKKLFQDKTLEELGDAFYAVAEKIDLFGKAGILKIYKDDFKNNETLKTYIELSDNWEKAKEKAKTYEDLKGLLDVLEILELEESKVKKIMPKLIKDIEEKEDEELSPLVEVLKKDSNLECLKKGYSLLFSKLITEQFKDKVEYQTVSEVFKLVPKLVAEYQIANPTAFEGIEDYGKKLAEYQLRLALTAYLINKLPDKNYGKDDKRDPEFDIDKQNDLYRGISYMLGEAVSVAKEKPKKTADDDNNKPEEKPKPAEPAKKGY